MRIRLHPALFVSDLQDANKKYFFSLRFYAHSCFEAMVFTSFFKDKKPQRSHKTVEIKVFAHWSGSGKINNGSGCGSRRLQTYGSYRCGSECGSGTLGPRLGGVGSYCGGPGQGVPVDPSLMVSGCEPVKGVPVDQGLMGWSLTVAVGRGRAYRL